MINSLMYDDLISEESEQTLSKSSFTYWAYNGVF